MIRIYSDYTKVVDDIWLNSTSMTFTLLSILKLPKAGKAVARYLQWLLGELNCRRKFRTLSLIRDQRTKKQENKGTIKRCETREVRS